MTAKRYPLSHIRNAVLDAFEADSSVLDDIIRINVDWLAVGLPCRNVKRRAYVRALGLIRRRGVPRTLRERRLVAHLIRSYVARHCSNRAEYRMATGAI